MKIEENTEEGQKITETVNSYFGLTYLKRTTALMIVNAGDKRYQLYLTSDDKKNALVRFIYEKPLAKSNLP